MTFYWRMATRAAALALVACGPSSATPSGTAGTASPSASTGSPTHSVTPNHSTAPTHSPDPTHTQGNTPAPSSTPDPSSTASPSPTSTAAPTQTPATSGGANVLAVSVSGSEGDYNFSVTLKSPDTGCDQYADWWEVLSPEGVLLYRRILNHSHPDEQPFTRSGGPVAVSADTPLIVRGHMNNTGYGGIAQSGSVGAGFSLDDDINGSFHLELASEAPLPDDCAF